MECFATEIFFIQTIFSFGSRSTNYCYLKQMAECFIVNGDWIIAFRLTNHYESTSFMTLLAAKPLESAHTEKPYPAEL